MQLEESYWPLHCTGQSGTAIFKISNRTLLHGLFSFLFLLSRQGHLSTVILLINHGADPYIHDGEGFQCIHLAAQFGHTALVAYLLAHGVPVNSPDSKGMTPLMWAVFRTTT